MPYAGFDSYAYPGDKIMAALKSGTNLCIAGVYLAPAPSHGDTSWMRAVPSLRAAGWGLAYIFVGQQRSGPGSHVLTPEQGTADGEHCTQLLQSIQAVAGARVFLDIEDPTNWQAEQSAYAIAWATALRRAGFQPAAYCSHTIAATVHAAMEEMNPEIWAYEVATIALHEVRAPFSTQAPSGSGYAPAVGWQHDQNADIAIPGIGTLNVDLSTWNFPDPSAP